MKRIKCKLLVVVLLSVIFTSCSHSYVERNKKAGNAVVEKIESYKKMNNSLPNSLQEIEQNEVINGVLFSYWKIDSVNYMLGFGTTLGEGIYYFSDTRQWEDRLRGIGNWEDKLREKENND